MLITLFEFSPTTESGVPQAFLYLSQTAPIWQLQFSFHGPNAAQAAIQGKREAGAEKPPVLTERLFKDEPVPMQMRHTSVAMPLRPSKPRAEILFGKQCPSRQSHLKSCLGTPTLLLADRGQMKTVVWSSLCIMGGKCDCSGV